MRNLYGKKIDLYPWQEEALARIRDRSALIAAPTGSGKTVVAYRWAELWEARNRRVIFTAPIKALSNERYLELRALFGDAVGILTGDVKRNPEAPLLCMTQEVYANRFCGLPQQRVIVDEIHYMVHNSDRARAYAEGIAGTHPESELLFLSATVDARRFLSYLSRLAARPIELVEQSRRPVPIHYLDRQPSTRKLWEELSPVLLFVFSYKGVMGLAGELYQAAHGRIRPPERERIRELAKRYRIDRPDLLRLATGGVAIYHGTLLYKEKLFIERLARENLLLAVVATDALSLGINLPVKTVLFAQLARYISGPIAKTEFLQMSGRAGRPNLQEAGYVGFLETRFEARGFVTERLFRTLKKKALEPLRVRPLPSIKQILNQTPIEEELKRLATLSFPPLHPQELFGFQRMVEISMDEIERNCRMLQRRARAGDRLLEILRRIYFDEFSVSENLSLAKTLVLEGKIDARQEIRRIRERVRSEGEALKELLQFRRFLHTLDPEEVASADSVEQAIISLDEFVLHPEALEGSRLQV
ncbi:putative helicase HelY [Methylacidimicrobium cyclopophantes]|uniref:Helicase HelY n=1 Tax=Methylacidimicrobium cyclopophantes TaxID=1041766 RepID=A0A5E6MH61_9BACT|nr:DEAD/DEAH box helicase [Methylacidimicrobium cyclopophantes]VVM08353.1 putative helicase HelY [Methylacidimicrobium cyclopophantes]